MPRKATPQARKVWIVWNSDTKSYGRAHATKYDAKSDLEISGGHSIEKAEVAEDA